MLKNFITICFLFGTLSLQGCFNYNPEDLPGYDLKTDENPDIFEVEINTEVENDEITPDMEVDSIEEVDVEGDFQNEIEEEAEITDTQPEDIPSEDIPSEDILSEDIPSEDIITPVCGNGIVEPPDEECDGDPDRDCTTTCGTTGTGKCENCKWVCYTLPDENCDNVDDDCDTIPDDNYVPTFECGVGVCHRNSICIDGVEDCIEGDPTGDDTNCNGVDEDCSGVPDDHYIPTRPRCGLGVCQRDWVCNSGTESCTPGTPAPGENDSNCNGIDENCNGVNDENYTTTRTCGVGPCTRYYQCISGEESCTPGTPLSLMDTTCNNYDDDCDGQIDEDYAPTRYCGIGACRRPSFCVNGVEDCQPGTGTTEDCHNGIDDDCDGSTDEGDVCPSATPVTSPDPTGGRFIANTSGSSNYSGSCGGDSAPEAVYYAILTQTSDVFITTHGSTIDTVVYVRECTCGGTELACNDNADGMNTSVIHLRDLPAGTYNIFIDGKTSSDAGPIQAHIYITPPGLEGDKCGDPIRLTGGSYIYSAPNSTCFLSSDYSPVKDPSECKYVGTGEAEDIVFYMWVPNNGTSVTLTTCPSVSMPGNIVDSSIYIRSICNNTGPGYQLGCSEDNNCGPGANDDYLSRLDVTLNRGLYFVFVDGYYQESPLIHTCGEFQLDVTGIP